MGRKFIFISEFNISQRDFDRFGYNILSEYGFDVYFWDCSSFLQPKFSFLYKPFDRIESKNLLVLKTRKELIKQIDTLSKDVVLFLQTGFDYKHLEIYEVISKKNIIYCVQEYEGLPKLENVSLAKRQRKIFRLLLHPIILIHKFIRLLKVNKFNRKKSLLKAPDYYFIGGKKSFTNKYKVSHNTKIISCHALDYDKYLRYKHEETSQNGYAVFIDEFVPFHPEYAIMGIDPPTKPDNYYNLMNNFFEDFKKKCKLEINIAAHPRSSYEFNNYFENYSIIRGKTCELVKDCNVVIAHSSNAILFAVLFKKPVILITTDDLINSFMDNQIIAMGRELDIIPLNINMTLPEKYIDYFKTNNTFYNQYKENYIKINGSTEQFFWEIVAENIFQC